MDLKKHLTALVGHVDQRLLDAFGNLDARLRRLEGEPVASAAPVASVDAPADLKASQEPAARRQRKPKQPATVPAGTEPAVTEALPAATEPDTSADDADDEPPQGSL